jgi:hypothetical protein
MSKENRAKQEINLVLIVRYHNEDKCYDYLKELHFPMV